MRLGERPWGPLLGDLGARGFSGRLEAIESARREPYAIVFQRGSIIDATSPLPADSALRAALTGHFVSATVVPAISRRIAQAPDRDDIDIIVDAARMPVEQARKLRGRVVLARAARTFALEDGTVTVTEDTTPSGIPPVWAVDVRAVVYQGARMHMSELRLAAELRALGGGFALRPDAPLAGYPMTDTDRVIVEALRDDTTLAELEARHRDHDPRAIQVMVYTLVSCGAARSRADAPAVARTQTPQAPPTIARTQTPSSATVWGVTSAPRTPAPASTQPPYKLAPPPRPLPASARAASVSTMPPSMSRTVTPRNTSAADIAALVASQNQLIDHGGDFFAVLGLATDAPPAALRVAHLRLAALLQPAHLALIGFDDSAGAAKRLLEQVEIAYLVLGDPARRAAYVATLSRANDGALRAARARTYEESAERTPAAEAYHRGQLAMRGDLAARAAVEFQAACDLDPGNLDYQVMRAFATFCAASNRDALAIQTRKVLERIILHTDHPELARYHLGRVERLLGRDREALRHFREVLEIAPNHAEAAAEVRVLEARHERRPRSGSR